MATKNRTTTRRGNKKISTLIAEALNPPVIVAPPPVAQTPVIVAPPPAPPVVQQQLVNHVAFIIDISTSMSGCLTEACRQIVANLENVRQNAIRTGQRTLVSVYTFGSYVSCLVREQPVESVNANTILGLRVSGMTALYDGVGTAIDAARMLPDANDVNTSFLFFIATDGGENASQRYSAERMAQLISETQRTDRWTFGFMVPDESGRQHLLRFGVPDGNITKWANTVEGARQVFTATAAAVNSFYAGRSVGQKSSQKLYATTDASKITAADLAKMTDLSGRFRKWQVDKEVELKPFVEGHGVQFVIGAGYYPVTKKELLRAGRNVLIREKGTNRIYGGSEARRLLGIQEGEVQVTPGNHANFDIFFQSTSLNRHLVRGTELLWDKTHMPGQSQETWDSAAAKAAADLKKAQQQPTS